MRIEPVVASRVLKRKDGVRVLARIGKPKKVRHEEWACPFHVSGLGMRGVRTARGIDSAQALMLAFEGIRALLEEHQERLSWQYGETGDLGFPRAVPSALGIAFAQRINAMIDREVENFVSQQKERLAKPANVTRRD